MVLHDQYPWDRAQTGLTPVGELRDDDYVVVFHPRNRGRPDFIRRVAGGRARRAPRPAGAATQAQPAGRALPAGAGARAVRACMPRLEALAVVKGEHLCTTRTSIRNGAYSWSPMTAEDIAEKTGIESRLYTARPLEETRAAGRRGGARGRRPRARGDRRGALLHLHEHAA